MMIRIAILMVFVFFFLATIVCQSQVDPMIVMGGIGGSNLEVMLKDAKPHDIFCLKNSDWYQIWINILADIRFLDVRCFIYNMELHFDVANQTVYGNEGVTIRPKDFGGIEGLKYYDSNLKSQTKYFYDFFNYFVINYGYIPGKNLRGATYDFRLSPKDWMKPGGFYSQLKTLVEETSKINGNSKVHFIAHSMSAPATNIFLNYYVSQEWKDTYIQTFQSVGGAWDGGIGASIDELVVFPLPGEIFQFKIFGQSIQKYISLLHPLIERLPGIQFMVPSKLLRDHVFIVSDKKNYTYSMYKELMEDIGNPEVFDLYEYSNSYSKSDNPPGVETHCIYSDNLPTVATVYIDDVKNPTTAKVIEYLPGDGTVPLIFSKLCDNFATMQKQPVHVHSFREHQHTELIQQEEVWEIIANVVKK